jgi:hypothetical protein
VTDGLITIDHYKPTSRFYNALQRCFESES